MSDWRCWSRQKRLPDNKRLAKLLRDAKLRVPSACVEDIDLSPKRELDRALVRQLSTG